MKSDRRPSKTALTGLYTNPFGRERGNSAFKKYDSDDKNKPVLPDNDGDLMRSPLTRGQQGEPSFGADSGTGQNHRHSGDNLKNNDSKDGKRVDQSQLLQLQLLQQQQQQQTQQQQQQY